MATTTITSRRVNAYSRIELMRRTSSRLPLGWFGGEELRRARPVYGWSVSERQFVALQIAISNRFTVGTALAW